MADEQVVVKKKKKKRIIIFIILLLGIGAGIFIWNTMQVPKFKDDFSAKKGMLSTMSESEIQDLLNKTVDDGYVNVFINKNPEFENGDSAGNVYIQNIPANKYGYRVEVKLKDTNETVLKTPYIKPGYNVEYEKLTKKLKKGSYSAIAVFTSYENEDDQIPIAQTNVAIEINVLN